MDRDLKRSLGQMMKGVQVVASSHDGITRAYCSHWVMQVSFDEPIMLASISPKHDTHGLIEASGWFTVSNLAGDQVDIGQYFSYPGRKFKHVASEWLVDNDQGKPVVPDCISWVDCEVLEKLSTSLGDKMDHDLFWLASPALAKGDSARIRCSTPHDTDGERLATRPANPVDRSVTSCLPASKPRVSPTSSLCVLAPG